MEEETKATTEGMGVGYFAEPPKVSDETIKWQLDPTDVLDEICHYLKQEVKDEEGKWKPVFKDVKPFMTDEGINALMGTLRQYLNKNVVLSNLKNEEILKMMKDLVINVLAEFIVMGYKKYKIEKENFNAIVHNSEHQIFAFIKRAEANGERLRWMKTQSIMEHHQRVEEMKPKKFGVF